MDWSDCVDVADIVSHSGKRGSSKCHHRSRALYYLHEHVCRLFDVPVRFNRPFERAFHLILPQWLLGFTITGVSYAYELAEPLWEPWVLTTRLQVIFIVFGIIISFRKISLYRGIPALTALIGLFIGIPTSIIW